MDLNHIELPVAVVVDLYQSSLVEDNEISVKNVIVAEAIQEALLPVADTAINGQWKSLGSNNKNILIIVNTSEAVHLPDNDLTFLTGILTACKLTLADVAIVNLNNHPEASYKELILFFKSKIVFLFDIEPDAFGLPMSFPHYQIQAFAGNSFLFSPSLKKLENDRVEKSKLWVCLKRLFNL
jgi:hypothetical protein